MVTFWRCDGLLGDEVTHLGDMVTFWRCDGLLGDEVTHLRHGDFLEM